MTDAHAGRAASAAPRRAARRVQDVALSADDRRVAAALSDGTVRVFAADGAKRAAVRLDGHEGPVLGVDIDPDGERVVSAGDDGSVPALECGQAGKPGTVLHSGGEPANGRRVQP